MIELIIGRESGTDSPRLAIVKDGATSFYGQSGSVPKSVSRHHCRITMGDDSSLSIEDVTTNNFMFINGSDCKKRSNINLEDVIELGPDHYRLNLEEIMKIFSSKQSWHIGHLQKVYEQYQADKTEWQVKQGKMNAASMLPGIISSISMLLMVVWESVLPRIILGTIAAVGMIYFFVFRSKSAKDNPVKIKQLDDLFREQYICPNPTCNHFLGAIPYKELLKNKTCPFCKAKFIE